MLSVLNKLTLLLQTFVKIMCFGTKSKNPTAINTKSNIKTIAGAGN